MAKMIGVISVQYYSEIVDALLSIDIDKIRDEGRLCEVLRQFQVLAKEEKCKMVTALHQLKINEQTSMVRIRRERLGSIIPSDKS